MDIQLNLEETKGYFEGYENKQLAAYLSFSRAGDDLIILDHTDVKPAFKGKGLGKQLVFHAVAYARKNNIKVMPLCPYASSVFQKEKSIRDVLR